MREKIDAVFLRLGLLGVAKGRAPTSCAQYKDYPIDLLPALDPTAPHHARRLEFRMEKVLHNEKNQEKRYELEMRARTRVYAMLYEACEKHAIDLARDLKELCDLTVTMGISGDYYDGPRAYLLVLNHLAGYEDGRTKEDEDFYEAALKMQTDSPLPDGCSGADYSKKAYAFVNYMTRSGRGASSGGPTAASTSSRGGACSAAICTSATTA